MSDGRHATQLSVRFRLTTTGVPDDLHTHGERVMQELLNLEHCDSDFTDSTVSTDALHGTITVELMIFDETDPSVVLKRALDVIRTAVHAAGGATPNWPIVSDQPDQVRMADASDLVSVS